MRGNNQELEDFAIFGRASILWLLRGYETHRRTRSKCISFGLKIARSWVRKRELYRRTCAPRSLGLRVGRTDVKSHRVPSGDSARARNWGELTFFSKQFRCHYYDRSLGTTVSDAKVLHECMGVLKPGGSLILFVPNKIYPLESHPSHIGTLSIGKNIPFVSWLPSFVRRHLWHAKIYSRRQLLTMATAAGLRVEKVDYMYPPVDSFPLPLRFKRFYRRLAPSFERGPLSKGPGGFCFYHSSKTCR